MEKLDWKYNKTNEFVSCTVNTVVFNLWRACHEVIEPRPGQAGPWEEIIGEGQHLYHQISDWTKTFFILHWVRYIYGISMICNIYVMHFKLVGWYVWSWLRWWWWRWYKTGLSCSLSDRRVTTMSIVDNTPINFSQSSTWTEQKQITSSWGSGGMG